MARIEKKLLSRKLSIEKLEIGDKAEGFFRMIQ
jgi:hypothetical protein